MSKLIVFCADGTWNGPAQTDEDNNSSAATNVFKLYLNLDGKDAPGTLMLANEQERTLEDGNSAILQIAKYLYGVGDSNNFLVKALGGTIGAGLITRVVRGYTFISRNYISGDKIVIIGFSRGAYTARTLAGLIADQGLLDATKLDLTDKTNAYRLGAAVWYEHLKAVREADTDWLGRLEELVLDLPGFLQKPPPPEQLINAEIEAVAVWETVGSLGIPEFTVKAERIDAFQFADTKLNASVRHAIHAVAVDEQRGDFTPTLWDSDSRVLQVLFPGAHADVGGGYPITSNESGISDCSLEWMTNQLVNLGIRFGQVPTVSPSPNPCGVAHQPWLHSPWNVLVRAQRVFPLELNLTQCLLDRFKGGPVVADPSALPSPYSPVNIKSFLNGPDPAPGISIA